MMNLWSCSEFSDFLKSNKVIDNNLGFDVPKDDDVDEDDYMNIDTAIHLNGLTK